MKENKNPENKIQYLPIGMCIGISIGTAIGAATDNIGVGMCLGVGIGTLFGSLLDAQNRKKEENAPNDTQQENSEQGEE